MFYYLTLTIPLVPKAFYYKMRSHDSGSSDQHFFKVSDEGNILCKLSYIYKYIYLVVVVLFKGSNAQMNCC